MAIGVCGFRDLEHSDALVLTVSSWAPFVNPKEWKDLWLLSPLSVVAGGVAVPGLGGVRSATVENAWQFLKVWPGEDSWRQDDAMAAFQSTCAIRYPRRRGGRAIGAHWGETGELLGYVEARRLYTPCYLEMLRRLERTELVYRLRAASRNEDVIVWDPDSYDATRVGLKDIADAIDFVARPFAHAFVVALAVQQRLAAIAPGCAEL